MDAYVRGDVMGMERLAERSGVVTPKGNIRDIAAKVVELLKVHPLMTSAEIAQSLFTQDYGISFDLFKRRIIVTTSRLHRDHGTLGRQTSADSNEVRWFVVNTKGEGHPEERPST